MTIRPILAFIVGLVVFIFMPFSDQAGAAHRTTVSFYGDSLGFQASPYLPADFRPTAQLSLNFKLGASLCDWLPTLDKLTASDASDIVVLQFIGNVSPCDGNVTAPRALAAAYKRDLIKAITRLLGIGVTDVVVDVGPRPQCRFYAYCAAQGDLREAYEQVVTRFGSPHVVYAKPADLAVETAEGQFTWTMSCLPYEVKRHYCAESSRIHVRSADGVHFCPVSNKVNGVFVRCPVYASGGFRFALGLARTVWRLAPATQP